VGTQDDVSEDMKAFLEYVVGNAPSSDFTSKLDDKVKKAREHVEWRMEYMTLLEKYEQMREEGREESLKEGLARARSEAARADAAEKELMALREKYESGTS
jgi:flagellar biosynthesis/type III secretory pathway protein FliH